MHTDIVLMIQEIDIICGSKYTFYVMYKNMMH